MRKELKIIKRKPMRARGVRFEDRQWERIGDHAKNAQTSPSSIIRSIIDAFYSDWDA